jgi:bifunctional non-homologous end joining protein LigD
VVKKILKDPEKGLTEAVETETIDVQAILSKAPNSSAPAKIKPMKATLVDEPFDDPHWLYEVKWDGYRAIATIDKKGAELISRNNLPFDKYYPIIVALKGWQMNVTRSIFQIYLNRRIFTFLK